MTIEERVRKIMLSKELSDIEKREQLRALIPADVCKIDNLNQATPAQLKQLKDGLAVTDAMQQIRCRTTASLSSKKRSGPYQNLSVAQALIGHDSAAMPEVYISVGRQALEKAAGHCQNSSAYQTDMRYGPKDQSFLSQKEVSLIAQKEALLQAGRS